MNRANKAIYAKLEEQNLERKDDNDSLYISQG